MGWVNGDLSIGNSISEALGRSEHSGCAGPGVGQCGWNIECEAKR